MELEFLDKFLIFLGFGIMGFICFVGLQRLRRMRDRLREMKQWWDEVMKEEEEGEEAEEEEYIPVAAENGKIPSQVCNGLVLILDFV
jgi:hypothetical protein